MKIEISDRDTLEDIINQLPLHYGARVEHEGNADKLKQPEINEDVYIEEFMTDLPGSYRMSREFTSMETLIDDSEIVIDSLKDDIEVKERMINKVHKDIDDLADRISGRTGDMIRSLKYDRP